MFQAQSGLLQRGLQSVDFALAGGAVHLGSVVSLSAFEPGADGMPLLLFQALFAGCFWLLGASLTRFYTSRRTEPLRREISQAIGVAMIAIAGSTTLAVAVAGQLAFDPIAAFFALAVSIIGLRLVVRTLLWRLRGAGLNYRNIVLVGQGQTGNGLASEFRGNDRFGIRLLGAFRLDGEVPAVGGTIADLGAVDGLSDYLLRERVDSVILSPSIDARLRDIIAVIDRCDQTGVPCTCLPFSATRHLVPSSAWVGTMPAFSFHPWIGTPLSVGIKRLMDVAVSGLLLLALLPLLLGVALAILVVDGGPVFFRQVRIGKDGRRFHCLKFRTMRRDAEALKARLMQQNESDGPTFKMDRDPRITSIGRFLRKYSLDELPQLINVLRGDMSLVGPRPPIPEEVAKYEFWQRRRISVRPGLTCYWQVFGRNRVSFDEWMQMDLTYIDNWSLWLDVKLIAKTIPAVVRGTGV